MQDPLLWVHHKWQSVQAELQLAKERLRRKSAVLARQEEEIAARGKAIDTATVDAQALQHAIDRAQQDAEAYKARRSYLRYLLCKSGNIIRLSCIRAFAYFQHLAVRRKCRLCLQLLSAKACDQAAHRQWTPANSATSAVPEYQ